MGTNIHTHMQVKYITLLLWLCPSRVKKDGASSEAKKQFWSQHQYSPTAEEKVISFQAARFLAFLSNACRVDLIPPLPRSTQIVL